MSNFYFLGGLILNNTNEIDNQKTDSSVLLRFSTEELWIHFIERKCKECDIPDDKCSELKSRSCFDEWINSCD